MGQSVSHTKADAEFIGLARLSARAVARVAKLRQTGSKKLLQGHMPELISILLKDGLSVRAVDVEGAWAELNAPQDLALFVLGSKAQTLRRLRPLLKRSHIGDQVSFTAGEWRSNDSAVLARIKKTFGRRMLAVRSSAKSEDGWHASHAGAYRSVLSVPGGQNQRIRAAIEEVLASYKDRELHHEVLVQAMLNNVSASGVVLTRTLADGAPYFTVNYDDTTASTTTVTSGRGHDIKTLIVHRNCDSLPGSASPTLRNLLPALREAESLVGHDALDIEFAVTGKDRINLLQLRPIAGLQGPRRFDDGDIDHLLAAAETLFDERQRPSSFIVGSKAIFGVMPDWNPAEIVGTRPRRLALSLYRHLVTDDVWAQARAEFGYRDVRPQPLLTNFAGHPYVDIRASFNSFIPAELPDSLAGRLVDHYLDRLTKHPELHDKVEFDIAFTCIGFDFTQQAQRLDHAGFSSRDKELLQGALRRVTSHAFERYPADLALIDRLEERFSALMKAPVSDLDCACALLSDCRRLGTLPFALLARSAFIAMSLLRSTVAAGVFSESDVDGFLNTLSTVAKQLPADGARVARGDLTWEGFMQRYAHLRPGTYEITSPSYAENPEAYLRPIVAAQRATASESVSWTAAQRNALSQKLAESGLPSDSDAFERFVRASIEGRESSKFAFTRNLSAALDALGRFGRGLGLDREEISHISIEDFLQLASGLSVPDTREFLRRRAEEGRRWHDAIQAVSLPPLILARDDLRRFSYPAAHPNFVGHGQISAPVIRLEEKEQSSRMLGGSLVVIAQADPGFDWIFDHNIAGLITMYGGANSHMAIRAAELGLPAAIGVGEVVYSQLMRARWVELDCAGRSLRIVE